MKRIIYAMLFTVLILLGSFLVVQDSLIRRVEKYYNTEAPEAHKNDREHFVDIKMYSLGANSYLAESLYNFKVNEDTYSFDLSIYHYQYKNKNIVEYGIFFEIYDFKSTEDIKRLTLSVDGLQSDQFIESEIIVNDIRFHNNWFVHAFLEKNSNEVDVFRFSDSTMMLNEIKSIKVIDPENKDVLLTVLNGDKEIRLGENTTVLNKKTDNFNGFPSEYLKLTELYEVENNVKSPDHTKLSVYNSIITRNISIYAGSVLVLTVFVFFRKPLAQMFENRRLMKQKKEILEPNPEDEENNN